MRYKKSRGIRRFAAGLLLASVWVVVLPGGVRIASLKSFMPAGLGLLIQVALLLAVAAVYAVRPIAAPAHTRNAEIIRAREWNRMTGPGWVAQYVRYGALMGMAIGVPIGAALAFGMKPEELPGNSRILMLLIFIGITMGWTLPASFGIRWLSVRANA